MRAELPTKINGGALYSIDVQLPGMLYGAVVRAPVDGRLLRNLTRARSWRWRASSSRESPYGVGVIAKTPWAAFAARRAVEGSVSWTKDGKGWGFDSEKGLVSFAAAARDPNAKATDWFKLGDVRAEMPTAASVFEAEYLGLRLSRPDGTAERRRLGFTCGRFRRGMVWHPEPDHGARGHRSGARHRP